MHTRFFPSVDLVRWSEKDYSPGSLHQDFESAPGARSFFLDLVAYLKNAEITRPRGFKETLLFEKLGWLACAVPDLKIIHLVRDPRAVVHSVLQHDMRKQWNYQETVPRYLNSYRKDDHVQASTEIDQCISSWKIRYGEAKKSISHFEHVQVRLEDLVLDPEPQLQKILALLGQSSAPRQLEFIRNSQSMNRGGPYSTYRTKDRILFSWKSGLPLGVAGLIEKRLHDEMRENGYV